MNSMWLGVIVQSTSIFIYSSRANQTTGFFKLSADLFYIFNWFINSSISIKWDHYMVQLLEYQSISNKKLLFHLLRRFHCDEIWGTSLCKIRRYCDLLLGKVLLLTENCRFLSQTLKINASMMHQRLYRPTFRPNKYVLTVVTLPIRGSNYVGSLCDFVTKLFLLNSLWACHFIL